MKPYFIVAALLLLVATSVQSQPGSLVTSFGTNGASLSDLSAGNRENEEATGIFVQSDGKRVVVITRDGYAQAIRFNADGSYDNTYGQGGFSQAAPMRHFGGPLSNAAIQSDGKIVAAGESEYTTTIAAQDFVVARWNTDGTLDATFGTGGIVTTDFGPGNSDDGESVQIQSDGKILVGGESNYLDNNTNTFITYIAFARYNSDGSLDQNFGSQGTVVNQAFSGAELIDMKLTPGGKIMALTSGAGSGDFILARFLSTGAIDASFQSVGYLGYDWGSPHPFLESMAIQSDGKILLGGELYNGTNTDFLVARYNADGTIDNTFDSDGKQMTDFGASEQVNALAVQTDGKILAAGREFSPTGLFALARYNTDGSLDGTFGTGGKQTTSFSGYEGAVATNLVINSSGIITAAGVASKSIFVDDAAIATYSAQGVLSQSLTAYYNDNGATEFLGFAVAPNGRLVAAGTVWNGIDYDFVVARFDTNGHPDLSFGPNGDRTTQFSSPNGKGTEVAIAAAVQGDGKIVAVGWFQALPYGETYFAVARYNTDGSLDATFNGNGMKLIDFPGVFEQANAVVIQSDGKILVGGYDLNADWDFALFRLNTDGSLDANFGTGGMVTTSFGYQDEIWGLALQTDGKILATGNTSLPNSFDGFDFCTVRYNTDGSVDGTYGTNGRVTTDFNGGEDFAQSIVLQSDGNSVVAGGVPINKDFQFGLARYNSNGTADASFGNAGVQTTDFGGHDIGYSAGIESSGKLDVAGFTQGTGPNGPSDIALARYNTDGTLDANFGTGGKVISDFGGEELGLSMGLLNRKIYVAGWQRIFRTFTGTDKYYGLIAAYHSGEPAAVEDQNLIDYINGLPISSSTKTSLNAKLQAALRCIANNDFSCACTDLQDFINLVNAQIGKKKLTVAQGTQLIAYAQQIMSDLGCGIGKPDVVAPEIPSEYALEQNYPNPFNPSTRMEYDLPTPSHVKLVVYDVLGQQVSVLVDEAEPAGSYNVEWNGTNQNGKAVPSGVYFYRITAGSFSQIRKMLLVR